MRIVSKRLSTLPFFKKRNLAPKKQAPRGFQVDRGRIKKDGAELFLYGGELQYFRVRDPQSDPEKTWALWEETLDAMVDAGINLVTTYVPPDVHALAPGETSFTGARNLRKFLQLAKDRGLAVVLKPGPSITGEWPRGFGSFGAIPEWWKAAHPESMERNAAGEIWTFSPLGDRRSRQPAYLDPTYLGWVKDWYRRFLQEVEPFMGDPVVGLQVDNETNMYWGDRFSGPGHAPSSLAFYRAWLQEKYSTIDALNQAYGAHYRSFEEVRPPSRSPSPSSAERSANQRAADWYAVGRAMCVEYLGRLKRMLLELGVDESQVVLLANDAPLAISHGDQLLQQVLMPDGRKNAVLNTGVDLYPKYDWNFFTPLGQPFQADFFTRLFDTYGEDQPLWAAEIQAGLFGMTPIPWLKMPVPPEATDQLLLRTVGRGIAAGSLYVIRDGLNANGKPYDYQAPIMRSGETNRRYDVVSKWGAFLERWGPELLRATAVENAVAILVDPDLSAPQAGSGAENQLIQSIDNPALFGWLAAAGIDPQIVDAESATAEALLKHPMLFFQDPGSLPEGTRRRLDDYVQQGGLLVTSNRALDGDQSWVPSRPEGAKGMVLTLPADTFKDFNRSRYYDAPAPEVERKVRVARELVALAEDAPILGTDDPRTVAWARKTDDTTFLFVTNDSRKRRPVTVTPKDLDALGLDPSRRYQVVEALSDRVIADAALPGPIELTMTPSGTAVIAIRPVELDLPQPDHTGRPVTRYVPGLKCSLIEPRDDYYALRKTSGAVGLTELGRTLGNPVHGRRAANHIKGLIRRKVRTSPPAAALHATADIATKIASQFAVSTDLVRLAAHGVNAVAQTPLLDGADFQPEMLPEGFELTELDDAPVRPNTIDSKEILPGVLAGATPTEIAPAHARRNTAFAAALNGLVNGRSVRLGGRHIPDLAALADALRSTGHHLQASLQQRVANPVPVSVQGPSGTRLSVPTPLFINTGLRGADGEQVVPATHAEWTFQVRGPDINADVSWFLGTGTATHFWPDGLVEIEPWQGGQTCETLEGPAAAEALALAGEVGDVLNSVSRDRHLLSGGYGVLAVCQDAAALVQQAIFGQTSLYPLLINPGAILPELGARRDGARGERRERYSALVEAANRLPHDFGVGPSTRSRILASIPYEDEIPFVSTERAQAALKSEAVSVDEMHLSPLARLAYEIAERSREALALTPGQLASGFSLVNQVSGLGLVPNFNDSGGDGGAFDPNNPVYRLDAVIDRNLPQRSTAKELAQRDVAPRMPALKEIVPGLYAGYRNSRISEKGKVANMLYAEVFDRLAENPSADEPFSFARNGRTYTRLDELIGDLVAEGHELEVTVEGHAAHATALFAKGGGDELVEIPTPILVKTGVTQDGQEAVVPALHSAIQVKVKSPPDATDPVDATVVWYTGLRGTHFYPADLYEEPTWAGGRTLARFEGPDALQAIHLAAVLQDATNSYAEDEALWAHGYGVVGVCNDAVAAVQAVLHGETTLYPLLMQREAVLSALARKRRSGDRRDHRANSKLYRVMFDLPGDADGGDVAERALRSLPYEPGGEGLSIAQRARALLTDEEPPPPPPGQEATLRRTFDRFDVDGSSVVEKHDVETYLRRIGLGSGFLGNRQLDMGVGHVLSSFDDDHDERITWEEFVRHAGAILFPALLHDDESVAPERVEAVFRDVSGGRKTASYDDVKRYLTRDIAARADNPVLKHLAGVIAESAGRLAMDALDVDGDGRFSLTDLRSLVEDLARLQRSRKAP